MKGIDLKNKVLVQAGTNMQVVKVTDVAELPVGADVSIEDVFNWARQEFNLEDDVCAYVPGEGGTDVEVLRSKWAETPAPEGQRLLFKPKAKPDGLGLDSLKYNELRELAKLHGVPANGKKDAIIAALSEKGVTPEPKAEMEPVKLEGFRREEDGVIVIPLDESKAATLEFYERKAEEESELVSTTSASAFRGMTLGDVKKKFGRSLLQLPSGFKKLFTEKGIEHVILVNGERQQNDFVFENGETIVVKRVKHYPIAECLAARFQAERFVGKSILWVHNYGQITSMSDIVAILINGEPGDVEDGYVYQEEVAAGDLIQIVFESSGDEQDDDDYYYEEDEDR